MNRAELSRVYAEQRLGQTKSTKGNVNRGTPRCKKHKQEGATKKHTRKPAPGIVLRNTKIKDHVSSPYEELQLENQRLMDALSICKMQHRGWLNTLRTLLSEPTPDLDFIRSVLTSELKRTRK